MAEATLECARDLCARGVHGKREKIYVSFVGGSVLLPGFAVRFANEVKNAVDHSEVWAQESESPVQNLFRLSLGGKQVKIVYEGSKCYDQTLSGLDSWCDIMKEKGGAVVAIFEEGQQKAAPK